MGSLDGKVAIVTGAGRGLGRSHALLLAEQGAKVVVNDLGGEWDGSGEDSRPAQQVVEEIKAAGGDAAANYDSAADWSGAEKLIGQAIDAFGGLDILINNAGILRDKMSFNMDEADWDSVINVHLKGHFAPSHHAARYWRERSKAGDALNARIVNTASEAGLYGNAGQANYGAAKAGIAALTIVMARELQRYGVTVNAISPRARTRMTETTFGDAFGAKGDFDMFAPENVSPLVAWLCTDDAADVSGQNFVVFGGRIYTMGGWSVLDQIDKGGQWTVDELAAKKGELFKTKGSGVPPFDLM
jgi:NAD(P)-dependent dehydrogenase (short-subunit alcohol dehydrogenase family)